MLHPTQVVQLIDEHHQKLEAVKRYSSKLNYGVYHDMGIEQIESDIQKLNSAFAELQRFMSKGVHVDAE